MKKLWWVLVGVVVAAIVWQIFNGKTTTTSVVQKISGGAKAPGFEGGGMWLNGSPLVLSGLLADGKTKAVLVDFWTYSCINCQRTIPYLRAWWEKYQNKGLMIVGVHSPEFAFEKETANVQMAIEKYGVGWPVVQDNEMKIWQAYGNNYWPRKYLINSEGKIVYDHIGEGGYEETERAIQKLLEVSEVIEVTEEPESGPMGFDMRQTPELYVNERGKSSGHLGTGMDKVDLVGNWEVTEDYAQAGIAAKLRLEFQAGQVNLVMSVGQAAGAVGVLVAVDRSEMREIAIQDSDLYVLWQGEPGKHVLEMTVDEGVRLHAFTFGK